MPGKPLKNGYKKRGFSLAPILYLQDNYQEHHTLEKLQNSIELHDVSFGYDGTEVLKDIKLILKEGRKKQDCHS